MMPVFLNINYFSETAKYNSTLDQFIMPEAKYNISFQGYAVLVLCISSLIFFRSICEYNHHWGNK